MRSLKELLYYGPGPSSSHTIGPYRICSDFLDRNSSFDLSDIEITLYGSLAYTCLGHGTRKSIEEAMKNKEYKLFIDKESKVIHPNTLRIKAQRDNTIIEDEYYSIGGGSFIRKGADNKGEDTYPFNTFKAMEKEDDDIYKIIEKYEGEDIFDFGKDLILKSFKTIENSLNYSGYLPSKLHLKAVSRDLYLKAQNINDECQKRLMLLSSYAYATSEANARYENIVTNPTCGAAGVVPSVLYYSYKDEHYPLDEIVKAYLVGALMCNFIKNNAYVSGAMAGCQAEIGSASSFATSSLCYLHSLSKKRIAYGAEVSMEHFLGLTCDPVDGYVEIPCIERNGIAAIHSYSSYLYSLYIAPLREPRVNFDAVIEAMKETGEKLPQELKETSLAGLAKVIC